MARARNIKPSFFTNEQVADQDPLGRLLFIGLWTLADYKGELEWKDRTIKLQLLGFDDCDIKALAINLERSGLIRFYSDGVRVFINIPTFLKHQNPHKNEREKGSDIPKFTEQARQRIDLQTLAINRDNSGVKPFVNGTAPADSLFLNPESPILNPDSGTLNPSSPPPVSLADKVQGLFAYWQEVMGKPNSILTDKREKAVKAILKTGYTVDQVKQAIDGCKRSPFHQGVNERRTVYDDLALICRDGEHLEQFINNIGTGSGVETIDMTRDRIGAQAARVAAMLEDAHP